MLLPEFQVTKSDALLCNVDQLFLSTVRGFPNESIQPEFCELEYSLLFEVMPTVRFLIQHFRFVPVGNATADVLQ